MLKSLYPTPAEIADIMRQVRGARIGVLGDFCIDAYWELDASVPELSIETGKQVQHVRAERYSPGGSGNVVVNLHALGVQQIKVIAIIGDDMFGRELTRELQSLGCDTSGLIVQHDGFATPVYGKPLLDSIEQQRMDFGLFNTASDSSFSYIQKSLSEMRGQVDFLVVNQQIPHGWCSADRARWMAGELQSHWAGKHIVDARHFVRYFAGNSLKVNQREAACVVDLPAQNGRSNDEKVTQLLEGLARLSDEAQFVTCGEEGIRAARGKDKYMIPGVAITGPIDSVGAGDAATAMLAACMAVKLDARSSAVMANMAAAVTVQKINQTGTANEEELIATANKLSYVHHPSLADELRLARQHLNTDVEIVDGHVNEDATTGRFPYQYAVFDHDGTLSTLRQGWESVMEPVMVHSILGNRYDTADSTLFAVVTQRVRAFIEQSTGIQTITQMDGLVAMIAEFDVVPASDRLDAWGYKRRYNDALMMMVNDRIGRLERGERAPDDFILKGAVSFLNSLRQRGVKLFLVSGTDEEDTVREAGLLGYKENFGKNIYGAKQGSRSDTKDDIIKSLLDTINAQAGQTGAGLLVIGDGPVEIKLGRRYGATALGIASNEERRFGINTTKRRRLIRAGAHIIAPDFSQCQALCDLLQCFNTAVPAYQSQ